ncbi:MAG: putative toxin-antitoxin system toxin component, PIN family [Novosphingobium sp.]
MSDPLRLVLDTNVVISALLWGGSPGQIMGHGGAGDVILFTSEKLLAELGSSLAKPRLARQIEATGISCSQHAENYASLTTVIVPAQLERPVSRDPDDDHVLACAAGAQANAVVTGDDDLLVLGAFQGILIVRVSECLALLSAMLQQRNER